MLAALLSSAAFLSPQRLAALGEARGRGARLLCPPLTCRPGKPSDTPSIQQRMLAELMNPLAINHERFVVAESAGERVGFGQIRPLSDPGLWELASVYVEQPWRGRGVGSTIVRELLARHESEGYSQTEVYLLCLRRSEAWYARLGFEPLPSPADAPGAMAFEISVGSVLTKLLGESLVCMRGARASE
ncbi:MAG: hypothetical protein SGPRY_001335 [Prymnesium sp.]